MKNSSRSSLISKILKNWQAAYGATDLPKDIVRYVKWLLKSASMNSMKAELRELKNRNLPHWLLMMEIMDDQYKPSFGEVKNFPGCEWRWIIVKREKGVVYKYTVDRQEIKIRSNEYPIWGKAVEVIVDQDKFDKAIKKGAKTKTIKPLTLDRARIIESGVNKGYTLLGIAALRHAGMLVDWDLSKFKSQQDLWDAMKVVNNGITIFTHNNHKKGVKLLGSWIDNSILPSYVDNKGRLVARPINKPVLGSVKPLETLEQIAAYIKANPVSIYNYHMDAKRCNVSDLILNRESLQGWAKEYDKVNNNFLEFGSNPNRQDDKTANDFCTTSPDQILDILQQSIGLDLRPVEKTTKIKVRTMTRAAIQAARKKAGCRNA